MSKFNIIVTPSTIYNNIVIAGQFRLDDTRGTTIGFLANCVKLYTFTG